MNEKVLVTGGLGSIGSRVVLKLVKSGFQVVILDNSSAYPFNTVKAFGLENINVEIIHGSIVDQSLIKKLIKDVDYIIHLAAIADVAECTSNAQKEFETNIFGTENLLEASRAKGIKKFTFISSASVYGSYDNKIPKFEETQLCSPVSNYALSKFWGEQRCRLFTINYGLPTVSLRLFSIYGSPQIPKKGSHSWCVAIFAMKLIRKNNVIIFGDGNQVRDFIHVDDVANAIIIATFDEKTSGTILNIGTGIPTSINKVFDLLSQRMKHKPIVEYHTKKKDDPFGGYAATSTTESLLNWKPQINLSDGIDEYLEWLNINSHLIPDFI